MKKVSLLPNVITAFGLSCGLFAIFKANSLGPGEANYQAMGAIAAMIILAALADLFDGAVARAMKAESEFGGLFDSLADAITFGVGPSIIILKSLSIPPSTELGFLLTVGGMVFSVCGVLRLVRFNVTSHTKTELTSPKEDKKHFTGLPIPAAAFCAVSANLLLLSDDFNRWFSLGENGRAGVLFFVMIVLGYFMISRWKFPSLKSLHIRVSSFQLVFATVVVAALIFYGLLHHFGVVFFFMSWIYVLIAWGIAIVRLVSGRRIKTLEEFEPDPDDFE